MKRVGAADLESMGTIVMDRPTMTAVAETVGVRSTSRLPQSSKWPKRTKRKHGAIMWRSGIPQWLRAAIVIVFAGGLSWMALKHVDTAALDAAMSEAARQRASSLPGEGARFSPPGRFANRLCRRRRPRCPRRPPETHHVRGFTVEIMTPSVRDRARSRRLQRAVELTSFIAAMPR